MNIKKKEIQSSADEQDLKPWYELSVNDGRLKIDKDGDGGHNPDLTDESINISMSTDTIVAVAQDGGLITYQQGDEGVPNLRAHLAWYTADDDILRVLKFVETE